MAKKFEFKSLLNRMPFGQYKGKTIGDIIIIDTTYAEWLFSRNNITVDWSIQSALSTQQFYAR